jgi:hypothetical protein
MDKVIIGKLTVDQIVKKLSAFYGIRMVIIMSKRVYS